MAVTISVLPTSANLNAGSTVTVVPTVGGTANLAVTWTTSDATKATVNSAGVVSGISAGAVTITATSVADGTKTATCAITVILVVTVVNGTTINALPGQKIQFNHTVVGFNSDQVVTYTLQSGGGKVTSNGLYEAGTEGTDVVIATSHANNSITVTVTITVASAILGTTSVTSSHRVTLVDRYNSYIQSVLRQRLEGVRGTQEAAVIQSCLAQLSTFGN